ncbi:hypothetical protein PAXRUDRAFT_829008 [Paxillus rubicundulus Ve08.2h10]|uniref:Uncharacterized protein n=1 Tax=Paxillus rubicundulus Ve08.2h10 TaxID=930991 RepID=A0A0D0D908_9AGAM|nr:hypothetical protein PAXRUDRAFT_829008 [Paxillus rubicundulus Ve08.2h10]
MPKLTSPNNLKASRTQLKPTTRWATHQELGRMPGSSPVTHMYHSISRTNPNQLPVSARNRRQNCVRRRLSPCIDIGTKSYVLF